MNGCKPLWGQCQCDRTKREVKTGASTHELKLRALGFNLCEFATKEPPITILPPVLDDRPALP